MLCVKVVSGQLCGAEAGPTGLCQEHAPGFKAPRKRRTVKCSAEPPAELTPQERAVRNSSWLSDK